MNRESAVTEARRRSKERARIAQMPDAELARYLSLSAQWGAKVEFRMALHEMRVVRGGAGVYRKCREHGKEVA